MVFLFVVSGINFCDKRAQRQTCLSAAERSKNHVNNLFDLFDNLIKYREAVEIFLILALFSDLPVYKATYDLLLAIFRFTKDFNKDYKYTVGESIKKETIELLTLIYRANVKRDKNEVLQEARDQLH